MVYADLDHKLDFDPVMTSQLLNSQLFYVVYIKHIDILRRPRFGVGVVRLLLRSYRKEDSRCLVIWSEWTSRQTPGEF